MGGWIEANLVIPSGPLARQPYLLTPEMWRHILHVYRLRPDATVHPTYNRPRDGLVYYGSQLRRPQKWGKDPLNAARAIAAGLGPVQFDGWDAHGDPVARPVSTPWVQIAGTSEDNTLNTWRPLLTMLREGPLIDTPGLDVGDTRVKLPYGEGWMEPVTAAARSRLGNPITFATFTEPHLMTDRDGGKPMVKAMKRNLTGMGGTWGEATNAWDPSEDSVAQATAQARAPGVYLDHRMADLPRLSDAEWDDDEVLRERLVVKYGDSAREAGGWVEVDDIMADARDEAVGIAEARRYYADEVTVGERDAVDATRWDALARRTDDDEDLYAALDVDTPVVLGFDGSRSRDCTALMACRIVDGRWFTLGIWDPADYRTPEQVEMELPGQVPEAEIERVIEDAHTAYKVWYLIADPYRWQHVLSRKAGEWEDNAAGKPVVVEFPTNVEKRMDDAIRLWQTGMRIGDGEFTHDGNKTLKKHCMNAALANGGRKPEREDEDGRPAGHYVKIVKKRKNDHIDAAVAGILATWGRSMAIEHGALRDDSVEPWLLVT